MPPTSDAALFVALQEAALSRFIIDADTAALLIFAGISGKRGDPAGAGGGDHGAGTVDRIHRLAADGGQSGGAARLWLHAGAYWRWSRWSTVGLMTIGDLRAFRLNPVMVKELRGRMRGVRGFAIISVFLTLMSFFTILLYLLRVPAGGVVVTGDLGRELFIGVLFIELMLIIFIVPALTAGAITTERERKTYDLLQTTLITKATFVVGKMQSALGYIVLAAAFGDTLAEHRLSLRRRQRGGVDSGAAGAAGFGDCAGRLRHVFLFHHRAHAGGDHPLLHGRHRHHRRACRW